ncbi:hypothetical protein H7J88_24685 [Mycolicibacterium flavescens]|nr:hypothetical protein [Mycolicibacterium flavescens]
MGAFTVLYFLGTRPDDGDRCDLRGPWSTAHTHICGRSTTDYTETDPLAGATSNVNVNWFSVIGNGRSGVGFGSDTNSTDRALNNCASSAHHPHERVSQSVHLGPTVEHRVLELTTLLPDGPA